MKKRKGQLINSRYVVPSEKVILSAKTVQKVFILKPENSWERLWLKFTGRLRRR